MICFGLHPDAGAPEAGVSGLHREWRAGCVTRFLQRDLRPWTSSRFG